MCIYRIHTIIGKFYFLGLGETIFFKRIWVRVGVVHKEVLIISNTSDCFSFCLLNLKWFCGVGSPVSLFKSIHTKRVLCKKKMHTQFSLSLFVHNVWSSNDHKFSDESIFAASTCFSSFIQKRTHFSDSLLYIWGLNKHYLFFSFSSLPCIHDYHVLPNYGYSYDFYMVYHDSGCGGGAKFDKAFSNLIRRCMKLHPGFVCWCSVVLTICHTLNMNQVKLKVNWCPLSKCHNNANTL